MKIVNLKLNLYKKRRKKRIKEDQKQEYRQKLQNTTINLALSLFRDLQTCWQEVGQVPAAGHEGGQVPAAPRAMREKVLLAGLGLFWQKSPWSGTGGLCAQPLVRSMQ